MSKANSYDLSASVQQSAVDKLISSVNYPFPVLIHDQPSPSKAGHFSNSVPTLGGHSLSKRDMLMLFSGAVKEVGKIKGIALPQNEESQLCSDIVASAAEVIESAKSCMNARREAQIEGKAFQGPDDHTLQHILDLGIEGLPQLKGVRVEPILSHLVVTALRRPVVSLRGPQVKISNANVGIDGTVQLWAYLPTPHCDHWCFHWHTTWSWHRLGSLNFHFDILGAADGYAQVSGSLIEIYAHLRSLIVKFTIAGYTFSIDITGFANGFLDGKRLVIFDAGQFVATVPVFQSRFVIDKVELPASTNSIDIDLHLKQLT